MLIQRISGKSRKSDFFGPKVKAACALPDYFLPDMKTTQNIPPVLPLSVLNARLVD
jgi:hypothetical protein